MQKSPALTVELTLFTFSRISQSTNFKHCQTVISRKNKLPILNTNIPPKLCLYLSAEN